MEHVITTALPTLFFFMPNKKRYVTAGMGVNCSRCKSLPENEGIANTQDNLSEAAAYS